MYYDKFEILEELLSDKNLDKTTTLLELVKKVNKLHKERIRKMIIDTEEEEQWTK